MKRKTVSLCSVLLSCAAMLSACSSSTGGSASAPASTPDSQTSADSSAVSREPGQLPISEEPVELTFACLRWAMNTVPYQEMEVLVDMEEKSNVKITWEEIDDSALTEKIGLMVSSGELPDVFYGPLLTNNDVSTFSLSGAIIPLDELIQEYAPNISAYMEKDIDYKNSMITPDGKIYSITSIFPEARTYNTNNMFINKTWLDKVGMDVPTTSEEFYEVLKAFKEQDPNGNGKKDEIPFSVVDKGGASLYPLTGMFGIPDNLNHLARKDGQVYYTAIQPEYKEAIKYFNRLYSEGLIDPELFTQDRTHLKAKGNDESVLLGSYIAFWPDDVCSQAIQDQYVHLMPMEGPDGTQLWTRSAYTPGYYQNRFSITKSCKNPEIAMQWLDYWMDDGENSLTIYNGQKGVHWGYEDEAAGTWRTYNEKTPEGMIYGQFRHLTVPGNQSCYLMSDAIVEKRVLDDTNQKQHERYLAYEPYLQPREQLIPELLRFTNEDSSMISMIKTDLDTYVNKMRAKWITEGGIDEEWDEYVNTVKQLQADELVRIYQNAIDAME